MSSITLVQRPRQQDLSVRIVSVQSRIDSVSLTRAGGVAKTPKGGAFDFDVDMSESSRTKDSLTVSYTFKLGRRSSGQVCRISGEAVIRFSRFNPEADFHTLGNDITNEMAVEIFRSNYEAMYLLHDALGMEAPSPWITQDVSLSSRNQTADEPSAA
jgi:hypothetical protein